MKNKFAAYLSAPLLMTAMGIAQANEYPSQNIQIIVPYSAGGGGDTVARIVADKLSDELNRQVNVVNREGAGGELGIAEIARSDSDGYVLGIFGFPDNILLEHTRDTNFSNESLEYLAAFDEMPMGLYSSPSSDLDSLDKLVEYAGENPGALVAGESGALGVLNILAFSDEADITLTPLRYDGGGELMNAIIGNHIDLASTSSMSHDPIADAGGTPLAFAAAERMEMFPDVPTFKEQGYDVTVSVSRVLVAPTGLPDDVRETLTEALDNISTNEEMIANFNTASLPYNYLDHDAVNEMVEQAIAAMEPVIEANREGFN